jgi:hypothetical protein
MRAVSEPGLKPSGRLPTLARTDSLASIVGEWLSQFEGALAEAELASRRCFMLRAIGVMC